MWVRNFSQGLTWLAGEIVKYKGQCSVIVKLTDGRVIHRHLDHIRQKTGSTSPDHTTTTIDDPLIAPAFPSDQTEFPSASSSEQEPSELIPRRSARHRRPLRPIGLIARELCPLLRREECSIVVNRTLIVLIVLIAYMYDVRYR